MRLLTTVWFQTLGTDATPHLFKGLTVYFVNGEYTNEPPIPLGDVDGDGKINFTDAQSVLIIMANDEYDPLADVDHNGKVDFTDYQSILLIMADQ